MINLEKYKQFLYTRKDRLEKALEKKKTLSSKLEEESVYLSDLEKSKEVMNAVSILAQTETKELIEELITKALQSVFGDDYSFEVENDISRNQPETTFYVVKNGERHPLKCGADGSEGGSIAVLVATVLRIVLWAISNKKSRKTIILDEPLKDSSKDKLVFLGEMLKQLSDMLGVQVILITHERELMESADKTFEVIQTNGESRIEVIR